MKRVEIKIMIKKNILLRLMLLGLWSIVMADQPHEGFDQYVGEWMGKGRFYNVNLNAELGGVPVSLAIHSDYRIEGQIGTAVIRGARISEDKHNGGYMIRGSLEGKIFPGNDFRKRKVIFLLQLPDNEMVHGDFHLKNNFIFDFTMRPGDLTLKRTP